MATILAKTSGSAHLVSELFKIETDGMIAAKNKYIKNKKVSEENMEKIRK